MNDKSDHALAVGAGAFWSSIDTLRLLAIAGLVEPGDVDVQQAMILEAIEEMGVEELVIIIEQRLDVIVSAIRSLPAQLANCHELNRGQRCASV